MKYNQTKYKLRTIWNTNETNKNKIDLKSSEAFIIKNNTINKFFYSHKKIIYYQTGYKNLSLFDYNLTLDYKVYFYDFNIKLLSFPIKYLYCINSQVLIESNNNMINLLSNLDKNILYQVEDLNSDNSDINIYTVVSIDNKDENINGIKANLIIGIYNPEFYI